MIHLGEHIHPLSVVAAIFDLSHHALAWMTCVCACAHLSLTTLLPPQLKVYTNFCFNLCLPPSASLQGPHEEQIIDEIFAVRKYNRHARPVENESDALPVAFGIILQQMQLVCHPRYTYPAAHKTFV